MSKHPKFRIPCTDCSKKFVGGKDAKYCPTCRKNHVGGRREKKYKWTPEKERYLREHYDGRVKGRAKEVADHFGWPDWVIKRHAGELGLSYPANRQEWTKDEEKILLEYAGRRHLSWLVKKLKRSTASVVMKLKHMEISRRWQEGYTLGRLQYCFGTDHHVIERWVDEGKLKIHRRGTERAFDAWYVTDTQILEFIKEYPMEFRLDKVDQAWFMDLLLEGGVFVQALERKNNSEAA